MNVEKKKGTRIFFLTGWAAPHCTVEWQAGSAVDGTCGEGRGEWVNTWNTLAASHFLRNCQGLPEGPPGV